nr:hypothetical protein HAGR004_22200 [Bdellovibrio sp. HAGR004]
MEVTKRPRAAICPNDVHCEIYNPMEEELIFERMEDHARRRLKMNLQPGPQKVLCKPDGFCYLPHQYYTVKTKSGRPCRFIKNFGDEMFKGNKKPSAPEAWEKKHF